MKSYVKALKEHAKEGHVHVIMEDGVQAEVSQRNVTFDSEHFEIDDGSGFPDIFPYDSIVRIEIPMETTE